MGNYWPWLVPNLLLLNTPYDPQSTECHKTYKNVRGAAKKTLVGEYKPEKLCHRLAGDFSRGVTVLHADAHIVAEGVQKKQKISKGYCLQVGS